MYAGVRRREPAEPAAAARAAAAGPAPTPAAAGTGPAGAGLRERGGGAGPAGLAGRLLLWIAGAVRALGQPPAVRARLGARGLGLRTLHERLLDLHRLGLHLGLQRTVRVGGLSLRALDLRRRPLVVDPRHALG